MLQQQEKSKEYTVADWETLPEQPRYELIDGVLYMQARPSVNHQTVSREIMRQLSNYLLGKKCQALAETSLRLKKKENTVFIPDISVVCDPTKITENYIIGAPDLIIEILSPSTARNDRILKLNRYRKAEVREYWIVDPVHHTVEVFYWEETQQPGQYYRTDTIKVAVLEDCVVDLTLVFPE